MEAKESGKYESLITEAIIDEKTKESIKSYVEQGKGAIEKRINELDNKWDIDRTMQLYASLLILGGAVLFSFNKRWLILSIITASFAAQHAIQGWSPPGKIFRLLGLRTKRELEEEKYALKMIRGDFDNIKNDIEDAWKRHQDHDKNKKPIGFFKKHPDFEL